MQYSHGRAGRGSILPCAEAGLAVRERSPLASVSCARRRGHRREASPCPQGAHSLTGAKRARKRGRARGCGQSRPARDVQRHAAGCTCWLVRPTPEHPGQAPCEAPGTQPRTRHRVPVCGEGCQQGQVERHPTATCMRVPREVGRECGPASGCAQGRL